MSSQTQAGFSLIELLVVIAIFAILATFALFMSVDFFRTYATNSEQVTLVTALSKARGQSVANINRMEHGVRITPTGYTIFEGTAPLAWNTRVTASDLVLPVNSSFVPTGTTDVVFAQLTGNATCSPSCTITISGNGSSKTVTLNSEGAILW